MGTGVWAAPQAELENHITPGGIIDTCGLGGDEGRVVEPVEEWSLQDLCHG
jgi:hypothetical protein